MSNFRFFLNTYIQDPEKNREAVVDYGDEWVIIKDKFPKAKVHLLVMPRDPRISKRHPLDALRDPEIYAKMKPVVEKAKLEAANLLSHVDNSGRNAAQLVNRLKIGVHAVPSMYNLHIHVISHDFCSEKLKHRMHYNSFHTEFFVDFDRIPKMQDNDPSLNILAMREIVKNSDLICWKCGLNFRHKFSLFKQHLNKEAEDESKTEAE